ncbi:MAG: mannitol dehydrogenase family protein [Alphaproteobacteria bacterium]|nr:mannitol dehydrogenase family protein [Alphaproteobacteria bacterium]
MKRLSRATLANLPAQVSRPKFDPAKLARGIVHLGCGAFHRAHQAWYTQRAIEAAGGDWGITGASLRGLDVPAQLNPQDGLYGVLVLDDDKRRVEIMGVIGEVLHAPSDPAALIARIGDMSTRIVSSTVTEKGYCHIPATGDLDVRHPDIVADLADPERPRSAIGILVAGLARARAAGHAPPTVLCCDNLPSNGRVVARLAAQYAGLRDAKLRDWIERNVAFPCTMIDRIVPATTDDDRKTAAAITGVDDQGLVVAEPFAQWVIEDKFGGPRPAWDQAGAQIVPDVAPYERAKLRLLNGAHSALAYRGLAKGHTTVAEAIADPELRAATRAIMREAAATLAPVPGLDLDAYADALCARFANRGIRHRLIQIAMDGSQKLPQRLLGTISENLSAGRDAPEAIKAVAAWIGHVRREGTKLQDPLAATLTALRGLDDFLACEAVFGRELPKNPRFTTPLRALVA